MKQSDPFETVTSALTARSFCEPLGPRLRMEMSFEEADHVLISTCEATGSAYDLADRVSLVYDGRKLIGWYSIEMQLEVDDSALRQIGKVVRLIDPTEIVSADTPAFKLVSLLAKRPKSGIILFVLDHEDIVGTVSPAMFNTPIFRLCLFSLTLELEKAALGAAMMNPIASWDALSAGRRAKAEEVYERLHGSKRLANSAHPPRLGPLLESTMFSDKGSIAAKRKLLPRWDRDRVESLFALAEDVRNWCAHTRDGQQSPFGLEAKPTAEFVDRCTAAISEFNATVESARGTS